MDYEPKLNKNYRTIYQNYDKEIMDKLKKGSSDFSDLYSDFKSEIISKDHEYKKLNKEYNKLVKKDADPELIDEKFFALTELEDQIPELLARQGIDIQEWFELADKNASKNK